MPKQEFSSSISQSFAYTHLTTIYMVKSPLDIKYNYIDPLEFWREILETWPNT